MENPFDETAQFDQDDVPPLADDFNEIDAPIKKRDKIEESSAGVQSYLVSQPTNQRPQDTDNQNEILVEMQEALESMDNLENKQIMRRNVYSQSLPPQADGKFMIGEVEMQEIQPYIEDTISREDENAQTISKVATIAVEKLKVMHSVAEVDASQEITQLFNRQNQQDYKYQVPQPVRVEEIDDDIIENINSELKSIKTRKQELLNRNQFKDDSSKKNSMIECPSLHQKISVIIESDKAKKGGIMKNKWVRTQDQDGVETERALLEQPKLVDEQEVKQEENVQSKDKNGASYSDLISYLKKMQLRDKKGKRFKFFKTSFTTSDYICRLMNPFWCVCHNKSWCIKWFNTRTQTEDEQNFEEQVGQGTVLYFQTTKTMMVLFFILTLLNVPLFVIFGQNLDSSSEDFYQSLLGSLSIASIAEDRQFSSYTQIEQIETCKKENKRLKKRKLADQSQEGLTISCKNNGIISQINDLGMVRTKDFLGEKLTDLNQLQKMIERPTYWPLTQDLLEGDKAYNKTMQMYRLNAYKFDFYCKNQDSGCDLNWNQYNIDPHCSFYQLIDDQDVKQNLRDHLQQNCIDKRKCQITSEQIQELRASMSCSCIDKISENKLQQNLLAVWSCSNPPIEFPFLSSFEMSRREFNNLVVIIDIFGVVVMIWFGFNLRLINEEKLEQMIESQLNIDDYTLQIDNFPVDKYSQDPRILQMKIWLQICDRAEQQMTKNQNDKFQIVDLNFNMQKYEQMKLLTQIENLTVKIDSILKNESIIDKTEVVKLKEQRKKINLLKRGRTQYNLLKEQYKNLAQKYSALINRRKLDDPNLFRRVPSSQRTKMNEIVLLTFNRMSFAKTLNQQNQHYSKPSSASSIEWKNLQSKHNICTRLLCCLLLWVFILVLTFAVHLVFMQPQFLADIEGLHLIVTPVSSLILFYASYPILKVISSSLGLKTADQTQISVFSNVVIFGFVGLGVMFTVASFTADLVPKEIDFRSQEHVTFYGLENVFFLIVGQKVCTLIIMIIVFKQIWLVLRVMTKGIQRFCDRSFKKSIKSEKEDQVNTKQKVQDDLNQLYSDNSFDTLHEQIQATVIILVCFLFSTGVPILYPIALVYFAVTYCSNKYTLLFKSNMPKYVSPQIANTQVQFYMLGIFCHLIFGFITVTEPSMQRSFDEQNSKDVNQLKFAGKDWTESMSSQEYQEHILNKRLGNLNDSHIFVYILGTGVFTLIIILFMICSCCCKKTSVDKMYQKQLFDSTLKTSIQFKEDDPDIFDEIQPNDLLNLYLKSKFELSDFRNIFEINKNQVNDSKQIHLNFSEILSDDETQNMKTHADRRVEMFANPKQIAPDLIVDEFCLLHKIKIEDLKRYESLLEQRVQNIEKVIDKRFAYLVPVVVKTELNRYNEANYREKAKYHIWDFFKNLDLVEKAQYMADDKYGTILRQRYNANRIDLINKSAGWKIEVPPPQFRMVPNKLQSYFIYDSPKVGKITRTVYNKIQLDIEHDQREQDMHKIVSLEMREEEMNNIMGSHTVLESVQFGHNANQIQTATSEQNTKSAFGLVTLPQHKKTRQVVGMNSLSQHSPDIGPQQRPSQLENHQQLQLHAQDMSDTQVHISEMTISECHDSKLK